MARNKMKETRHHIEENRRSKEVLYAKKKRLMEEFSKRLNSATSTKK